MVIQSNMTSKAITDVWEETVEVFQKYNVPITERYYRYWSKKTLSRFY
ncbi:hypothetical protein [Bacillus salipaludis]